MLIWIGGGILFFVIASVTIGLLVSAPKYDGPQSDHFNGKTFVNKGNVEAKGFSDVFKWMMKRDRQPWEPMPNIQFGDAPPTESGNLRVTFINHATFLIQVDGVNILTDPIWSQRTSPFEWAGPKRMRPPGIQFEDLPRIDAVIISHNHYDHLDIPTVKRLEDAHQPLFIVPLGVKAYLENKGIKKAQELDWWEHTLAKNVRIHSVPAQHFSGRGMADRDATLWCGYVLQYGGENIYFAGDTGYGDFFQEINERFKPFKLALLPIGAYKPRWFMSPIHISPEEAVQVHQEMDIEKSIGMHYGTFPLADDGREDPLIDLQEAKKQKGVAEEAFVLLTEGEGRNF